MRRVHLSWAVKQSSSPQSAQQSAACSQVLRWLLATGHWLPRARGIRTKLVSDAADVPVVRMLPTFSFPVSY